MLLATGLLSAWACDKKESVDSTAGSGTSTRQAKGKGKVEVSGKGDGGDENDDVFEPSSSSGGLSSTLRLEQSASLALALDLAAGETVVAVGRSDKNLLNVVTSTGRGYVVDLAGGSLTTAAPFAKYDASTTTTLTVSPEFVWLLFKAENQVGRNKAPPDASKRLEVTKVTLGQIVDDVSQLTPLAATDEQLYLIGPDALVVCTFKNAAINLKSIPLPDDGLLTDEQPLGAGAVGTPAEATGFWLATDRRLLLLDNRDAAARWSVKRLEVDYDASPPTFVSLSYQLDGDEFVLDGTIAALFGGTVSALDQPKD